MTWRQRFAREWLWYVACAFASIGYLIHETQKRPQEWGGPDYVNALIEGSGVGIGVYLLVGLLRLTFWAIRTVSYYDEAPH